MDGWTESGVDTVAGMCDIAVCPSIRHGELVVGGDQSRRIICSPRAEGRNAPVSRAGASGGEAVTEDDQSKTLSTLYLRGVNSITNQAAGETKMTGREQGSTRACECEHVSHATGSGELTPNGKHGHEYMEQSPDTRAVRTVFGVIFVCGACAADCWAPANAPVTLLEPTDECLHCGAKLWSTKERDEHFVGGRCIAREKELVRQVYGGGAR